MLTSREHVSAARLGHLRPRGAFSSVGQAEIPRKYQMETRLTVADDNSQRRRRKHNVRRKELQSQTLVFTVSTSQSHHIRFHR